MLVILLRTRYPKLFSEGESEAQLRAYLSKEKFAQETMLASRGVDLSAIEKKFSDYVKANGSDLPMNIGEKASLEEKSDFVLFLVSDYKQSCQSCR